MAAVLSDVTAFGSIKGGRLFLRNRRTFNEDLRRFRDDTEVEVEVHALKATRSVQMNKFYWGPLLGTLADYTGHSTVELHEHFKATLIPVEILLADAHGEVKSASKIPGSTRKMTTDEFWEYVTRIAAIAGELGCEIPDPSGVPFAVSEASSYPDTEAF